ncbi:MAG: class I SAM-dependent methyltransferase [Bacteroidetes bacterium]|nr:class I SAM-dependent methyltransferase [Bacteroidota bacterium]MDA0859542.1 class I SAM-dependent methyltransferase [Bacteroidota bacterium]MDA1317872.1 class I SAM-dependent methyltransferase [Bacteroidota bacterium]
MTKQQNWFQSWFDTPYYHILYKQRNYEEAQRFIKNLITYLNINKNHTILDLACGKGRHSFYLNSLGFDVTGVDLSTQNILEASKNKNTRLKFMIHDMRLPIESKYDVILNMFTSFGYFDSIDDNFKVLKTIKNSLNKEGFGVIDFMNSNYVINHLVPQNYVEINGLQFDIKRNFDDGIITKTITVTDGGKTSKYEERVRAFSKQDFLDMISKANLSFVDCFGNYDLEPYEEKTSDRLILIFKNNV